MHGSLAPLRVTLFVDVKGDGHRRVGKLHCGKVHEVSPYHQLLSVALNGVRRVAGCMSKGLDGMYSRCKGLGTRERPDAPRCLIGRKRSGSLVKPWLECIRCVRACLLAEPEIDLLSIDPDRGVRKHSMPVVDQAAGVVKVLILIDTGAGTPMREDWSRPCPASHPTSARPRCR